MTGKVVNLKAARKARARDEARAAADANAARHGRSKAERLRAAAEEDKAARDHEGHKRE